MRRKLMRAYTEDLADRLGWKVATKGKRWEVLDVNERHFSAGPNEYPLDLPYRPASLLAMLLRVATSPPAFNGEGMDPVALGESLAEKHGRPGRAPSQGVAAFEEADCYEVWPELKPLE